MVAESLETCPIDCYEGYQQWEECSSHFLMHLDGHLTPGLYLLPFASGRPMTPLESRGENYEIYLKRHEVKTVLQNALEGLIYADLPADPKNGALTCIKLSKPVHAIVRLLPALSPEDNTITGHVGVFERNSRPRC